MSVPSRRMPLLEACLRPANKFQGTKVELAHTFFWPSFLSLSLCFLLDIQASATSCLLLLLRIYYISYCLSDPFLWPYWFPCWTQCLFFFPFPFAPNFFATPQIIQALVWHMFWQTFSCPHQVLGYQIDWYLWELFKRLGAIAHRITGIENWKRVYRLSTYLNTLILRKKKQFGKH